MARKTPVFPASAPIPAGPYTPAVIAGNFVFVSGQSPKQPGTAEIVPGGIREQTHQVLQNIRSILAEAGCMLDDVVKVAVHLADMKDFAAFNAVYAEHFQAPYPARTTVQSVLPGPFAVEIDVIALRPGE
jgi:2-iminobutanoate/2-iminopropanoate deaminase